MVALRIALHEWRLLFFSPIAWLLLIVFGVQASAIFLGRLEHNTHREIFESNEFVPITYSIFAQVQSGLLMNLRDHILLYVPLVTMGLMAREFQSGSIKLLQSSPIKPGHIVIGKYLAVMSYFGLFALFLLLLMAVSGIVVINFEYPTVLSGILGIYLLCCAYAAVGLFMSSLTRHQVVAAVSTFGVLALLGFLDTLGQRIPLVADIAYWLSMSGRAEYMIQGLIASKDVFYFTTIVVLFLSLTYLRLVVRRGGGVRKAAGATALIATVLCFGFVSSLPRLTFYYDAWRTKQMTIAPETQEVLSRIEGPWRITAYINILADDARNFLPRWRNRLERNLFDPYVRANPDLEFEYIYYYAHTGDAVLDERGEEKSAEHLAQEWAYQHRFDFERILPLEEVDAEADFEAEAYRPLFVVSWQGESEIVRTFDDSQFFPQEDQLATGLKRLASEPLDVGYVTGQGERSISTFGGKHHQYYVSEKSHRRSLVNEGFRVNELSLREPVSDDVDVLVVAAPTEPYSAEQLRNIHAYMDSGRNLMLMAEPGTAEIIDPIILRLGLSLQNGQIFERDTEFSEDTVFPQFTDFPKDHRFAVRRFISERRLMLSGASLFRVSGDSDFTTTSLVIANPETMVLRTDEYERAAEGDIALALERKVGASDQRIVLVADADFMSSSTLASTEFWRFLNNHSHLFSRGFRFLANDEYPIDTFRGYPTDNRIDLELHQVDYFKLVLYGVLPLSLLLAGAGLLTYRRRF